MRRYTETKNYWKTGKALEYFANFIRRHNGPVFDCDAFAVVEELLSPEELIRLIKETFPEKTITRMQNASRRPNRLDFDDDPREIIREIWSAEFARARLKKMLFGLIDRHMEQHPLEKCSNEPFARRSVELQETLSLTALETNVLMVISLTCSDGPLASPESAHSPSSPQSRATFIAKCLDCDVSEVLALLDENSKLRRYHCLNDEFGINGSLLGFLNGVRNEPLSSSYFRISREEVLPWEFYGSLAQKHGGILKRIIDGANGKSPVNILLYGAPGTGKTSFARTLAAELKRKCCIIAQDTHDHRSNEATSAPSFRFGALQICSSQVDPAKSLIIVDEADEMLRGSSGGGPFALFGAGRAPAGDKGMLNALLDHVTTPTIWITNSSADELDESSRRRFDYSIRFEALDAEQRLSIWRNNVEKMKLGSLVSEEMMRKFAKRYPVSAGGITLVLQNLVKLIPAPGEVEELVETLMKPHCELLGVENADEAMRPAEDYSLEGLNIDGSLPLPRLIEAVRRFREEPSGGIDRPRMNILLSGAPGTGKTEFVKYLGAQLGVKVVVLMGSDLLSMFVGGTEKLIRRAFEQAEAERAILFLDEIDGLVQSRSRAQRSWEVTQVNELLHRMENFTGVMVGATNFAANLDAAILRRFTFKLEFDYLDDAGKKLFFERMFGTPLTDAEAALLAGIPNLAPGDFRTVRQGLFYLGGDVTNAERLEGLRRESAAKQANRFAAKGKMGF
ncbi:MAG: ATP-binding protein [Lentisphaeria bacterium]|nr:ATP-binding protein [Lentisphaeria bacterium]